MNTWLLVGNGTAARVFCAKGQQDFRELHVLTNPSNRLHERDLQSDAYGRTMSSGTDQSESYGEPGIREHERDRFAGEVAEFLGKACNEAEYDGLYLVCSPTFLGALRKHLPQSVVGVVKEEIPKNLVTHSVADIRTHLPERI